MNSLPYIPDYYQLHTRHITNQGAIVLAPHARFTILTSRMIRMEYSPVDEFEDRASQVFWFREQPIPEYKAKRTSQGLDIYTEHLHLRYKSVLGFIQNGLSIKLLQSNITWHYGDIDPDNLLGTGRTLDEANGAIELDAGLVSRSGWSVIDDTQGLVFNESGWLELRNKPSGTQDLYFLGYGHDYQNCLKDYCEISGSAALIPRWALGNWWSRYWEFSQQELSDLMLEFRQRQVPLSVCIIDMDWHVTKTNNQSSGWTGYTWNNKLFPDPRGFLAFLHSLDLHTALNLHPAEGIHPHEAMYSQMATSLGVDPASEEPIKYNPVDPIFVNAHFKYLHHPQEEAGVDFWWMDWQQGNPTNLPGLNLLWWINHLHFMDLSRTGSKRSFIFSRWGGLGSHRYPIGFSGDTIVSWASLAFQPYMTATAANVGYGWWSHDIGGHMRGIEDAELFTRWVQFGVFSPIMRLHSTKNPYHERRPWGYDAETFQITRYAMQLRHSLIPYLYSMAWKNHDDGTVLVHPMYYLRPEDDRAYLCPNQYTFGSELVVAPFISPVDKDTCLSRQVIWLPEGAWYGFFENHYYSGDSWHALYGAINEIPVFAREGAIVPLAEMSGWAGIDNPDKLVVHIFPGRSNQFNLYEDDGESSSYLDGLYSIAHMKLDWTDKEVKFSVCPANSDRSYFPKQREVQLIFHTICCPDQIMLKINDRESSASTAYDAQKGNFSITGILLTPNDSFKVVLMSNLDFNFRIPYQKPCLQKMLRAFRVNSNVKYAMSCNLDPLLENPDKLAAYVVSLSSSQQRALFEVLTGAGCEHITNILDELVVFWNNSELEKVTYSRSGEPQYLFEKSVVPKFMGYRVGKIPLKTKIAWNLSYFGLLNVKLVQKLPAGEKFMYPGPD